MSSLYSCWILSHSLAMSSFPGILRNAFDSQKAWLCSKESIEIDLPRLLDQFCIAKSRNNVACLGSTNECAPPGPLVAFIVSNSISKQERICVDRRTDVAPRPHPPWQTRLDERVPTPLDCSESAVQSSSDPFICYCCLLWLNAVVAFYGPSNSNRSRSSAWR